MSLTGLLDVLRTEPAVRAAIETAREGGSQALDVVAPLGVRPALLAAFAAERPLLVVTATGRESEDLATWLRCYLPPDSVAEFPAWETLPHERLSPRSDTVAQRLAVLRRLAHPAPDDPTAGEVRVVVAPVRAVLQPLVKGLADLEPVRLRAGEQIGLDATVEALAAAAYSRVDMVERRGEFAVRGGILDVFPPTRPHPLRVEFFGDEVEEVRSFSVADQRTLEVEADGVWAPPCRELLLTPEVRRRAAALVATHPEAADVLTKLAEGIAVEGMESLAPALVDGMEPLLDVLPAGTHVVLAEPEKVRARAHDLVATGAEFLDAAWMNAAVGGAAPVDLGASSFWTLAEVRAHAEKTQTPWWSITSLTSDDDLRDLEDTRVLRVAARDVVGYRGETEKALADLRDLARAGWRIVLTTEGHGPAKRLVEMLSGEEVPARLVDDLVEAPEASVVVVTTATMEHGFVAEALKTALVTEADLTGVGGQSTKDMRRMAPRRRRNVVDPLTLNPGDFVVHEQHGVAKFLEMVQRTIQGATREYLVLEYAASKRGQPGDRLFVPTDTLDQVTRYTGGEAPTLSKMGGSDWSKTKSKARRAVKQIAGDLIRLYSARMATKGHEFGPDTPWQRELEDAFPYIETPDQLASIDEVKADMMKPIPMDRLICGDVGYGKTEIALRAAFKAVQDGKQVAVLVPTTLLVQQHFKTFAERYASFPVVVKPLSRFTPGGDSKETLAGLADGSVDVVIGTHRLISGEVKFKDLGLVVVDEEQRFGVEHKEALKTLRTNVDVLAMSATPIPRTLEMAVTGIREMSTLATPPEERHPVLTYVGGQEEKQITAAIRRELLREGQVFYVHNRVQSIERTAARLKELVPEARIATAHGQMGEHRLEQVVVDFWEKRFDVLVCTTIVETGLDISNANTLIVERADAMGLSQLHQLRGRVGRGRERAYAYFTFPPEKPLTETAHDRLATIAQHSDLGSGMAVAMKDLEIRGAGNMLGGEQSGHIAGVGFDLYMRMVADAVAEARNQVPGAGSDDTEPDPTEVKIELPIDAHLPHDYIDSERLRLDAYRRLAGTDSESDLEELAAELLDRYGVLPQPVLNLFEVARFRIAARRGGLREVSLQGKQVRFAPIDLPESRELRLKRLYPGTLLKPALSVALVPAPMTARIGGKPLRDAEMLAWVHEFVAAVLLEQPAAVAAGR
ncbi:MAG: transcription-repair coupling factor [Janthinobacterium lividum]